MGLRSWTGSWPVLPSASPEGRNYFAAMKCGINMSFANRQVILHRIREVFSEVFGRSPEDTGDAHGLRRRPQYRQAGAPPRWMEKPGAFWFTVKEPPGPSARMEGIPAIYREVGQPVIIGGSMETGSYLLVGTPQGDQTFFSTAHGSGRTMSRTKARKMWRGKELQQEMEGRGIYVRTASWPGLAEEAGGAYKNIDDVILATEKAGISKRVVRFVPVGNVKG